MSMPRGLLLSSLLVAVLGCEGPAAPAPAAVVEPPAPAVEPPAPSAPAEVMRRLDLGGRPLEVPAAWAPKHREKGPLHVVHVAPAPGITCDLGIIDGDGRKENAERYLNEGASAYDGEVARAPDLDVGGLSFQGIRVTSPKAFADHPGAVVEVYVAIAGEDLIGVGVTRLEDTAVTASARRRCLDTFASTVAKVGGR